MNTSQTLSRRVFIFVQLILIAVILVSTITAQTSSVDLSFNPVVSKTTGIFSSTFQPDGKILTYGNFQVVNGVVRTNIARLNADGSLDNSFNCTTCNFIINSAVVQPDGKIIVAGRTDNFNRASAIIYRLNADGSYDASFTSPFTANNSYISENADVRAVQPDGKILVVLFRQFSLGTAYTLLRLNPNGSFDDTFSPIPVGGGGRTIHTTPGKISVLPNGKILIITNTFSVNSLSATLRRYNANGTEDSTFEKPTFAGTGGFNDNNFSISDFQYLTDGSLIIIGRFLMVNGISRTNIVKLLPAGNVDLTFAPTNAFQNNEYANRVEIYSNGKILISTTVISIPGGSSGTTNRFIRYNADGSVDNTFTSPADLLFVSKFVIDSSDGVLLYGAFTGEGGYIYKFARLNADGSVNSSFIVNYGIAGSVSTAAIQADGKVLIGGDFMQVGNVFRNKIARLNADGTVDQTFNTQLESNYTVNKIAIQADGKILVTGSFTINNVGYTGLIRLNSDGSLDTTFNPVILDVRAIVQQPDGKILVGGGFTTINGQTRPAFARLNSDGTIDTSFNVMLGNGSVITSVILQRTEKSSSAAALTVSTALTEAV